MTDILYNISTISFSSPLLTVVSITIGSSILFNVLFNKNKSNITTTKEVETQTPRSDTIDFSLKSFKERIDDLEALNEEYKETNTLLQDYLYRDQEDISRKIEHNHDYSSLVGDVINELNQQSDSIEREYLTNIPSTSPEIINQATTNNTFDFIYDILWFPITILKHLWGII